MKWYSNIARYNISNKMCAYSLPFPFIGAVKEFKLVLKDTNLQFKSMLDKIIKKRHTQRKVKDKISTIPISLRPIWSRKFVQCTYFFHVFLEFSTRMFGIPCEANILLSLQTTVLVLVDDITSTSGYREYLSTTTSKYLPFGSGPLKSRCIFSHGKLGIAVILRGSGGASLPVATHGIQFLMKSVITFPILGNHTFSRRRAFSLLDALMCFVRY